MEKMLQEAHLQDAPEVNESSEAKQPAETIGRPPVPAHPRFAKPQRVAFVQSSWHREVVEECRIAFLDEIEARHIARAQIDLFEVPGSFEIPLHAQLLAKTRRYTAIVAAEFVVEGGFNRHLFVGANLIKRLIDVPLDSSRPRLTHCT